MNVKYLVGFLIGFALAFGMFGDYARYGQEIFLEVLACEREYNVTCDAHAQPDEMRVKLEKERAS